MQDVFENIAKSDSLSQNIQVFYEPQDLYD